MNLSNTTHDRSRTSTYQSYIAARTWRNPCLQNLSKFLADDSRSRRNCRIACLEFSSASHVPISRNLDLESLANLLHIETKENDHLQGRILIIEDLSKDIIQMLGSNLNIDPFFFASHIDAPQSEIVTTRPYMATLPSAAKSQNFLTLHYHHALEFEHRPKEPLLRDMNVPRKVKALPSIKNVNIGLARQCCSIMRTVGKDGLWLGERKLRKSLSMSAINTYPNLGLILVDVSFNHSFIWGHRDNSEARKVTLQTSPFQGGFEDFLSDTFSNDTDPNFGPWRRSLLEDMIFYWSNGQPHGFDVNGPTLVSLSYYPLKVVAAEWMTYLEVLYHSTKEYEYDSSAISAPMEKLAGLYTDLYALQKWARRNMASSHKLRYVIGFLKHRSDDDRDKESITQLIEDYEHIASTIGIYGRRLKATVPIVTSLIQIIDSQRSLIETANITRLTYLAMIFVPLTFVASLFSMNQEVTSSVNCLRFYFAVAIPMCALVFLIARPPKQVFRLLASTLRKLRDAFC